MFKTRGGGQRLFDQCSKNCAFGSAGLPLRPYGHYYVPGGPDTPDGSGSNNSDLLHSSSFLLFTSTVLCELVLTAPIVSMNVN